MEIDQEENELHITFMTRIKSHQTGNTFHFPDLEDISTHGIEDAVFLLPQPTSGTTLRSAGQFRFNCEHLQRYDVE